MKIKRNTNTNAINFERLSIGDIFKDIDTDYLYMRIVNIETYDNCIINTIALESGEATYFADGEFVVVIDGELVTHE